MLDNWTDRTGRSFASYSISIIDNEWQHRYYNLGFRVLKRHTARNLTIEKNDIFGDYNLNHHHFKSTTDRGSDILAFLKQNDIKHEDCCGHQLHLLVSVDVLGNKAAKPVNDFISKLKKIARTLRFRKTQVKEAYNNFKIAEDTQKLGISTINELEDVGEFEFFIYFYYLVNTWA